MLSLTQTNAGTFSFKIEGMAPVVGAVTAFNHMEDTHMIVSTAHCVMNVESDNPAEFFVVMKYYYDDDRMFHQVFTSTSSAHLTGDNDIIQWLTNEINIAVCAKFNIHFDRPDENLVH